MIRNLLTADEQGANDASLWYASQNCTIARSTERYIDGPATIKMTPVVQGGADMEVTLTRSFNVQPNTTYRIFAYFCGWCSAGAVAGVRPILYDSNGITISTSFGGSAVIQYNVWTLISTVFTTPANAVTGRVVLSVEANMPTFFDQVGFVEWPDELPNDFMRLVKRWVPQYMKEADDELTEPNNPLTRFLDVVTVDADSMLTSVRNFDYIPRADGVVGYERSTLVDPTYYPQDLIAEATWLPWLAQLVGVQPLAASSGGSLTPWFWFEQNYPTWNAWQQDIDTAANPVFQLTSISRDASGIVTATLGTQTSGSSYTPQEDDAVELVGTVDFDGAFVVQSVSGSDITWYEPGDVATETSAGSITFSDASWSEVEQDNPQAFQSVAVLAHLTRTGATGINSGSLRSIIAAARAVMEGFEDRCSISRSGNVVTVTSPLPHGLAIGDYVAIYDADNRTLNTESGTVASVIDAYSFTVSQNGYDVSSTFGWVTNKEIQTSQGATIWELTLLTNEGQTYAVDLLIQAINKAKPAGLTITHGYTTP